jgi:predicted transcriptional regulator
VARLGQLERSVMETLWSLAAADPNGVFTAREIASPHAERAYTTILTVLDRLTNKGFVERVRDGRTHHYRPCATREQYIAELMHEALAFAPDRDAALIHFAESVTPDDADVMAAVLKRTRRPKGRSS